MPYLNSMCSPPILQHTMTTHSWANMLGMCRLVRFMFPLRDVGVNTGRVPVKMSLSPYAMNSLPWRMFTPHPFQPSPGSQKQLEENLLEL